MKALFGFLIVSGWFAFASVTSAYLVDSSNNLEQLAGEADIIFKATAVSSERVEDEWFKPCPGFGAVETRFKVISVIKGALQTKTLRFRHYDEVPQDGVMTRVPQSYHFEKFRTYVVFAKTADEPGVFRQLWSNHKSKKDQGSLMCANDQPAASENLKEIFWTELIALLASPASNNTIYAIRQLDEMSDLPYRFVGTKDFDRSEVIKAISPLMTRDDEEIANKAITVVGSRNPYLSDDFAKYWLATVGSAEVSGIAKMDSKIKNFGGEFFWEELCSIADGKAPVATRALAIRSLGLVRKPSLLDPLSRWVGDAEPSVRAAAALLLADFPGEDTRVRLTQMGTDSVPEVRRSVAYAIGFMQSSQLANTLGVLLKDSDARVRRAASQSLLSFSPKLESIAKVFRRHLGNDEFSPLFLNALAVEYPGAYVESLAQAIEQKAEPRNWAGGQIPAFTSFNILFKYLQSQPAEAMRAGKFDRFLDAIEDGYVTGSSEPRDIYAFYLQRGMTERAKIYRESAKKAASFDIDYFFKMVDQNPENYTR